MESQANNLYDSFLNAGNALAALYRAAESAQTESFTKGQKDTLNEIIQYILKESDHDPRKMTTNKLLEYLDIKLREVQANVPENNMPLQTPSQTSEIPNIMELGLQSPSIHNTWSNQSGFPEGFQTRQLNEEVMNMGNMGNVGNQSQGQYGNQQNQYDNNNNNQF